MVQLAVPAKSCKSCCVPDHKLGWDGSAVWWGLHNTRAAYIWLKALLLIPHFHEHKKLTSCSFHFSKEHVLLHDTSRNLFLDWIKFLKMKCTEARSSLKWLCIPPLPSASHHWKMKWVLAWMFLLLSNSHCTSCQLLTSVMIEILTHVKKQDSYRIFVNLYYFALWSFFRSLPFFISFSNVLSQLECFGLYVPFNIWRTECKNHLFSLTLQPKILFVIYKPSVWVNFIQ